MKTMQFPVAPKDILEFKTKDGETVRGEVAFVTFSVGEDYATIYDDDIFMKKCKTCNDTNISRKKCKYAINGECTFRPDDVQEIYANEIGKGKKYKIVDESWRWEQ